MICCKIVTDFNVGNGDFSKLCGLLSKYGDCMFEGGNFYFGDTTNISTDEKTVRKILKKSGYNNFYISIYNKENQPSEYSEMVNGWLTDKLIRINYTMYENESQELFRNISKGLDLLNRELEEIKKNKEQEESKEEES